MLWMSTLSGSLTRMKTIRVIAMRMDLWLSCLLLAGCSTNSVGGQSAGDPSAPRPCVVLHTDPGLGMPTPEGSLTMTKGCMLTVWTEQGGHQTFPNGTQLHLKGWKWTSQPLAFHCSCEAEGILNPVNRDYRNFIRQHLDQRVDKGDKVYCNEKMKEVNMEKPECKKINTFIHATKQEVIKVCRTEPIRKTADHLSAQPFKLTVCKYYKKPCQYKAINLNKKIRITCRDNKPVHFVKIENQGYSVIV